jgi:Flp pilus assembly protein CpaB
VVVVVRSVSPSPPELTTVTVAAADLPAGRILAPGDVRSVAFEPDSVPDGLAHELIGRTLAAPLRAGEPVTDVRLIGAALAESAPGLRALPVRFPDAAAAGLLHPGEAIDLVAIDPRGRHSGVIARGVLVLAVPPVDPDARDGSLTGRLLVLGVPEPEVQLVADAAVQDFLSFTFSG